MTTQQVYDAAEEAVTKLVQATGPNHKFPFDEIWGYATTNVDSAQRPAAQRHLTKQGYIEKTGLTTRASTQARAGSPTSEYRPGPRFRPAPTPTATPAAPPATQPTSVADALKEIQSQMLARGFISTLDQLANFYLALKTSPLVILAGTSGTGKSWLPRLFAELIGADFTHISVQPQWSDNSDLFGYTPSLTPDTFIRGRFTDAIIQAVNKPDKPHIVLLDEMNLAAVEHYFSDFLSVIATRKRDDQGRVISDLLPLDVGDGVKQTEVDGVDLRALRLPHNLKVVGTANLDETTQPFSPKVLDRATTIEYDEVDLTAFPTGDPTARNTEPLQYLAMRLIEESDPVSVMEAYPAAPELFDHVAKLLTEVQERLKPARILIGFRPRDSVCLYLYQWQEDDLTSVIAPNKALDYALYQKILPKVSGSGDDLDTALLKLERWLRRQPDVEQEEETEAATGEGEAEVEVIPDGETEDGLLTGADTQGDLASLRPPCERSAAKVKRMRERLGSEMATTFWGT